MSIVISPMDEPATWDLFMSVDLHALVQRTISDIDTIDFKDRPVIFVLASDEKIGSRSIKCSL